ncbi:type III secretion system stator protein SctL [Chromobacterium vaccinii]|uniref:type III secretion system stator protein SctL n=1 Tax=Chromobacterium vaccinii TaxID=1108595 RepID=UPI003C7341B6
MTLLSFPIAKLPGNATFGPIIPADDLASYINGGEIVAQAQAQAKQILEAAEREAEQLHELCEQALEAAWQNGLEKVARETPALRQQAVADTVEWLLDQRDLEQAIIERLEGRLLGILVSVFEECYGRQSESRLLASLLRDRIGLLPGGEEGTLHVCPEQHEELRQALISCSWLRIEADADIASGKALLQTPLVILSLDLDEQFNWAISRLLSSSRSVWKRPESDINHSRQEKLALFPEDISEACKRTINTDASASAE